MRKDIIITGSGGQGVIMLSVLLANAYGISEGYEIAQTQSYGAQARGGASQSSLIVSDEPIDYIEVEKAKGTMANMSRMTPSASKLCFPPRFLLG